MSFEILVLVACVVVLVAVFACYLSAQTSLDRAQMERLRAEVYSEKADIALSTAQVFYSAAVEMSKVGNYITDCDPGDERQ